MFDGFVSDNASGAHPRILEAMVRANAGYCSPYGTDAYCAQAEETFRAVFGKDIDVFFALSGTGGNVMALRAMLRPWQGVIATDVSHIFTDESGAPEWGVGAKVLPVPSVNGKMHPEDIDRYVPDLTNIHHSTPHVVSITQSTELGTVYRPEEIAAIAAKAHRHGMLVHMDGTRLANAVAALDASPLALTRDAGVDALSFGGTKNGLMLGEAVIFFKRGLADDFLTMRKQSLQLVSKMRFVAAQFHEALKDGLWIETARHANAMAAHLAEELGRIPHVTVKKPEVNAVFARMRPEHIARLQQDFFFHEWDAATHEVRLMCSFATTREEIAAFVDAVKALV